MAGVAAFPRSLGLGRSRSAEQVHPFLDPVRQVPLDSAPLCRRSHLPRRRLLLNGVQGASMWYILWGKGSGKEPKLGSHNTPFRRILRILKVRNQLKVESPGPKVQLLAMAVSAWP